jgi:hypothetical protein
MENIFGLVASCLSAVAGWFLYRNPAKVLDFVFGKDDQQQRPVQFFRVFGILMMVVAGLSVVVNLLAIVLHLLAINSPHA